MGILHNEELSDMYCIVLCGYKTEKNEMGGSCSAYGNGRSVYGILVWKPVGKRPLGRIRRRRECNVTMDVRSSHTVQR